MKSLVHRQYPYPLVDLNEFLAGFKNGSYHITYIYSFDEISTTKLGFKKFSYS